MNASTLAERLTEQISAGAEFAAIARNFSQSPTAAVGGSLGWIRKLSLPAELKGAIESLEPGQVSEPIRTLEGIYILQLISKRLIEPLINRPKTVRSVMLQQIHFEVPAESSPEIWASIKDKAQKISSKASSCDDMDALGSQFGSPQSGSSGKVKISQLSSTIQKALRGLPLEQASKLIKISDGFLSIMICRKDQEKAQKMTKIQFQNKIMNQLMNERINLAAQQYLRGLRRSAVIDIRF